MSLKSLSHLLTFNATSLPHLPPSAITSLRRALDLGVKSIECTPEGEDAVLEAMEGFEGRVRVLLKVGYGEGGEHDVGGRRVVEELEKSR